MEKLGVGGGALSSNFDWTVCSCVCCVDANIDGWVVGWSKNDSVVEVEMFTKSSCGISRLLMSGDCFGITGVRLVAFVSETSLTGFGVVSMLICAGLSTGNPTGLMMIWFSANWGWKEEKSNELSEILSNLLYLQLHVLVHVIDYYMIL